MNFILVVGESFQHISLKNVTQIVSQIGHIIFQMCFHFEQFVDLDLPVLLATILAQVQIAMWRTLSQTGIAAAFEATRLAGVVVAGGNYGRCIEVEPRWSHGGQRGRRRNRCAEHGPQHCVAVTVGQATIGQIVFIAYVEFVALTIGIKDRLRRVQARVGIASQSFQHIFWLGAIDVCFIDIHYN